MKKTIMKYASVCLILLPLLAFAPRNIFYASSHNSTHFKSVELADISKMECGQKHTESPGVCIPKLTVEGTIIPYAGSRLAEITPMLSNGVVWLQNGANFGELGNVALFGHSSNYPWYHGAYNDIFGSLHDLEKGDVVILYSQNKNFVYKVIEKRIVSPRNLSVIQNSTERSTLTLITCWPAGTSLRRLVVIAERVPKETKP